VHPLWPLPGTAVNLRTRIRCDTDAYDGVIDRDVVRDAILGDVRLADKQSFVLVPVDNLGGSASDDARHLFLEGGDGVRASRDNEREGCSTRARGLQRVGLFAAGDKHERRESGTWKEPHRSEHVGRVTHGQDSTQPTTQKHPPVASKDRAPRLPCVPRATGASRRPPAGRRAELTVPDQINRGWRRPTFSALRECLSSGQAVAPLATDPSEGCGVRLSALRRLPYLTPDTDSSPSPALRHRGGLHDRDSGDRANEVLVTAAGAPDSVPTLAHAIGIRRVAPATAHSAWFLLARSVPNARRAGRTSPKILTQPATDPAGILEA
jgi:hypothetical protein